MPATLSEQPLAISCVFSDGTTTEISLETVGSELGHDLLVGLVELVHPHGTIDAASTVAQYMRAVRNMVSSFSGSGFSGGAAELTRGRLTEWFMGASVPDEACTRRMLRGFDTVTGGLGKGVGELTSGRAFNPQFFRRALPPYSETEWARLHEACTTTIDESFAAHQAALAAGTRGEDPATGGWSADNLAWLLARTGPSSLVEVAAHVGISTMTARRLGGFIDTATALFPHLEVAVAYVLGFGMCSGIVPDGIADLVLPDIDWSGDASILLSYIKGRSGPESAALPRRAVRLLEQWLSHSSPLRGFVAPMDRDQLWLRLSTRGSPQIGLGPVHRNAVHRFAVAHDLRDDAGLPLRVRRHRIRTTHQSLRDKRSWTGNRRARIDPNHSAQVEGDHYLAATTPAQQNAVDAIIEDAQHDLVRRAHPPSVLTGDDTATLAGAFPELVAGLDLDDATLAELLGGERDVFMAACADQLSGLHGPKGRPCPARPWVCLACPLAVFAPRHAANLLRLKAFFSRQWRAMPAAEFMAVFGVYAGRLDEVLARYEEAVLVAATAEVAGSDDELPLRAEERST